MYFNYYSVITIQIFIIFIFSYAFNITAVFTMHLVYAIWMCVCAVCVVYTMDVCDIVLYMYFCFLFVQNLDLLFELSWRNSSRNCVVASFQFIVLHRNRHHFCLWMNKWVSESVSECVCEWVLCERRLIVCTSYLFFTLTAFPLVWINPLFDLCDKHKLFLWFYSVIHMYMYVYICIMYV